MPWKIIKLASSYLYLNCAEAFLLAFYSKSIPYLYLMLGLEALPPPQLILGSSCIVAPLISWLCEAKACLPTYPPQQTGQVQFLDICLVSYRRFPLDGP